MKVLLSKNKTTMGLILILVVITAGEIAADKIWGDGDGTLTNYNIHKYIFTIQLIIAYYLFFKLINKLYLIFFKDKISTQTILYKTGKIFFILLVFISSFLILEITSRYFFPGEGTFDRLYPVENARKPFPYVMFKGAAKTLTGFGKEIYNEHGYRGAYPESPKDTNEFRIILIGGSAVWEGEPSLAQLLEEEFKKNDFSKIRVYNFGVVSSVSSMELAAIVNEIITLSPDLVVMYNGANDITSPFKYDPRPGYPFNFLAYENNPFFMKNYPAFSLFIYKSNLIRLFARKYFTEKFSGINGLKKNVEFDSEKWRNEITAVYLGNLKKARTICSAYHCQFYSFLQPMVYFKKNPSAEELNFITTHQNDKTHSSLMRNCIQKKLSSDRNDSTGFYFKDLTDAYNFNSSRVFRDDVHTLQPAKPFIAKEIFTELISKINIRK